MEEDKLDGFYGEEAPQDSSPETTETPDDSQDQATDSVEPEQDNGQKHVPYDRFSEVTKKYRETESELEYARQELARFREQQQESQPQEEQKFESPEDIVNYNDKTTDEKLAARDAMWESKLEARNKMSQLEQEFPESKTDAVFRNFLSKEIDRNPSVDILKTAQSVRDYFKAYEEKGRKAAEKQLAERGSFQGGVVANQPMRQTDADRDYAKSIVEAGGGANDIF